MTTLTAMTGIWEGDEQVSFQLSEVTANRSLKQDLRHDAAQAITALVTDVSQRDRELQAQRERIRVLERKIDVLVKPVAAMERIAVRLWALQEGLDSVVDALELQNETMTMQEKAGLTRAVADFVWTVQQELRDTLPPT